MDSEIVGHYARMKAVLKFQLENDLSSLNQLSRQIGFLKSQGIAPGSARELERIEGELRESLKRGLGES